MKIKKQMDIDVELSPEEIAKVFCDMNSEEQAAFFNEVAVLSGQWKSPFCFQLQRIIEEESITGEGLYIMEQIGEYGGAN